MDHKGGTQPVSRILCAETREGDYDHTDRDSIASIMVDLDTVIKDELCILHVSSFLALETGRSGAFIAPCRSHSYLVDCSDFVAQVNGFVTKHESQRGVYKSSLIQPLQPKP